MVVFSWDCHQIKCYKDAAFFLMWQFSRWELVTDDKRFVPGGQSVAGQSQFLFRWRPWWSLWETIILGALWVVQRDVVLPVLKGISLRLNSWHRLLEWMSPSSELTGRLLSCSRSPRICTRAGNIGLSLGSPCQQASMMPYLPAEGSTITTKKTLWSTTTNLLLNLS